ncbi:MAG: group III truncated hemoglobin [Flavobacteriaceae bacterium]|nr:group III truncated hemoglobin [Flavobacteriaceae bacterium]
MMQDIQNINDIKQMVDSFYGRVQKDDLIGPIFNEKLNGRWPEHLEKMYKFWETVLLDNHSYYGSPFAPHARLPVEKLHFDRWVMLFNQNMDEQFKGDIAEEAKWRAAKMAQMFNYKIDYIRENET